MCTHVCLICMCTYVYIRRRMICKARWTRCQEAMCARISGAEDYPVCESFQDCRLHQSLLSRIDACGFKRPSAVQASVLLPILDGRDIFLQAGAGAGKTSAFLIASLAHIDCTVDNCQVLILPPTREAASDIFDRCRRLIPEQVTGVSFGMFFHIPKGS